MRQLNTYIALLRVIPAAAFCCMLGAPLYAARPLAGIAGIESRSPRTAPVASLLETHLSNVLDATGVFTRIDTTFLKAELARFNCGEDGCVLRFAKSAKLGILIRGRILDHGDTASLELYCFSPDTPHDGRMIYRYTTDVVMAQSEAKPADYSAVYEEHAAMFLAGLLRAYRRPVPLRDSGGGALVAETDAPVNGKYQAYRYKSGDAADDIRLYDSTATLTFTDNRSRTGAGEKPLAPERDFILYSYKERAEFLEDFYYGRKKEMVFESPSAGGTMLTMLFTVPGSAAMPLLAPMGYYTYGDFEGLYLWAVNAAPYLYLEYSGLTNRPRDYKDRGRNISPDAAARHSFAWYMLLAGGLPLFVDAYSHHYLSTASQYREVQPLMGSSITAAYLSLVSGGAGHFYRGYRLWGYLYFHLDNILLYYSIRNFTPGERYDSSTGSYEKGSVNRRRGYIMLGSLAAVKAAEIAHVLLLKDNIRSGAAVEERFTMEPGVNMTPEQEPVLGLRCAYRF